MANHASNTTNLGTEAIPGLLLKLSVPASIGFLVMTIYQIVDTIFIGRFVGVNGIGGIAIVMPITMLISSVGMGLGLGGASVISRALGARDHEKGSLTFNNLINLSLHFSAVALVLGFLFPQPILHFFGGKGEIYPFAYDYFMILLPGLPFLSIAMLCNNVIRAEGNAKTAMYVMVIPAILNLILDPIFIVGFKWGIKGAALATTVSYIISSMYALYYFVSGKSQVKLKFQLFAFDFAIVVEVLSIGFTSIARQGSMALLAIVMNKTLFTNGGETAVAAYGIISRLMMFVLFPIIGLGQGFMPICGFNYGAKLYGRVRELIRVSLISGVVIGTFIGSLILIFPNQLTSVFTDNVPLIELSAHGMRFVFMLLPLVAIQLICSVYFQAIGKALPSLLLTLLRQGIILIPLVLILSGQMGLDGAWYAFPISDLLATVITVFYSVPQWKKLPQSDLQYAEASV